MFPPPPPTKILAIENSAAMNALMSVYMHEFL